MEWVGRVYIPGVTMCMDQVLNLHVVFPWLGLETNLQSESHWCLVEPYSSQLSNYGVSMCPV